MRSYGFEAKRLGKAVLRTRSSQRIKGNDEARHALEMQHRKRPHILIQHSSNMITAQTRYPALKGWAIIIRNVRDRTSDAFLDDITRLQNS